jgi:hypothetical protein
MGKKNNLDDWDSEGYSKPHPKKEKKIRWQGISTDVDLSNYEQQKIKTQNRRKNKQRDKNKYDSKYDDWN